MRKLLAWTVGIVANALFYGCADALASMNGLPSYIDYGDRYLITRGSERYGYDDEVSGNMTDFGFFILALAVMVGTRVGMAIHHGELPGNVRGGRALKFQAWFVGLLYLTATAAVRHLAFASFHSGPAGTIRMGLMIGAARPPPSANR